MQDHTGKFSRSGGRVTANTTPTPPEQGEVMHDCEKWIDEGVCCTVCKPFAQTAAAASFDRAWGVDVREALARVLSAANASRMGEARMVALCDALSINTGSTHGEIADALLRPAPLPADAERDAREAAWFRWLRDNPQAAAFTAVNVAKWVPAGPDLGATMASGTVVGEMEDAKNPEYRYHIAASSLPADVLVWTEGDIENLRHVGRSPACGPQRGGALLDLADRLAAHQSADASKMMPADVQAVSRPAEAPRDD